MDSQRLKLERQDVIAGLLEAIELAKERQEPAAMIRGYAELARLMGYYAPERRKVEVMAGIDTAAEMQRYSEMSDAQLHELMAS